MTDKREANIDELLTLDERRLELLTVRHNLAKALYIDVLVWGFSHRIFRSDAEKVFADIDTAAQQELSEIEEKFRALNVTPSEWTPPPEDDAQ